MPQVTMVRIAYQLPAGHRNTLSGWQPNERTKFADTPIDNTQNRNELLSKVGIVRRAKVAA